MQRRTVWTLGMAALVVLMVALPGCCKKKKKSTVGVTGGGTTSTPIATSAVSVRETKKLDAVIKCYNAASRINRMARYYKKRLRGRSPGRYRVPYILFKPMPSTVTKCNTARGMTSPAMPALDGVMSEYVPLVGTMVKEINEMDQYYRSKEYKTDKFAKGKLLDVSFKAHLVKFKQLHNDLAKGIDSLADKRDEDKIKRLEANKNLRYYTAVFSRDAKLLSRVLPTSNFTRDAFSARVAAVGASYKLFADFANGHPEQTSKVFLFSSFKRHADSFIGAVRSASATKPTVRQREKISDEYNDMVDASNRLRWRL